MNFFFWAPVAFVRRKDHHGNLFTSCIACYGFIPSSTIYAWYSNPKMVPIFQKINELWDFYQPWASENMNQNVRIRCLMKCVQYLFYNTVNLLKMLTCIFFYNNLL